MVAVPPLYPCPSMEEAQLLKERLQAITDKRKLQEEITQKRLKVEEEKLKLQHLKKKALREKWLLDGVSAITPKEQEEMQRQNQEDQKLTKLLERNILRLEQEIEKLEQQELQISANEVRVLKKLKSVERTSEDIIRAVKAEVRKEPVEYIYSNIPDLPKSYRPSKLRRDVYEEKNDDDQSRKALFAMEIKVEKDMKTGESTVLSTIPLPSEEFKHTGVKVYDDGRKSVYAVNSPAQNGVDSLAPVEVEDLLRKATEKNAMSPTEYHEPVFSYPYSSSPTPSQKEHNSEPPIQEKNKRETCQLNGHPSEKLFCETNCHESQENGFDVPKMSSFESQVKENESQEPWLPRNQETRIEERQHEELTQDKMESHPDMRDNYREAMFRNSECSNGGPSPGFEDDVKYSLVHAMPCYIDDGEPVTMVFMGYQHVDDDIEQSTKLSDFDGIIRAELVVIDDDEDDKEAELSENVPSCPTARNVDQPTNKNDVKQKSPITSVNMNLNKSHHINSISLQEQQTTVGKPEYYSPADGQPVDDGTEDPSLTALRLRMAKLGKRVI